MALPDKVEAVKKVSETLSKQSVNPAEELERVSPNKDHFDSLMNTKMPQSTVGQTETRHVKADVQEIKNTPILTHENLSAQKSGTATDQERKQRQQSNKIDVVGESKAKGSHSLMTEVAKLNKNVAQVAQMKPEDVKAQAKGIIDQLEQVKSQLNQAKVDIKPSYQTLLRNRLSHIDDNLKIALSKAGVEYTPPVATAQDTNPVKRFINGITNSQNQLDTLHTAIDKLTGDGAPQMSAAQMISIQIKMGYIQQEVELFSNLLNKVLESIKTVMNVQV